MVLLHRHAVESLRTCSRARPDFLTQPSVPGWDCADSLCEVTLHPGLYDPVAGAGLLFLCTLRRY